ncbi:MAG: hypothetical protein NTZ34_06570, partial [Chloroflexi bacterium]|nr:hypothetical protein [Chloroflexota bacterium]
MSESRENPRKRLTPEEVSLRKMDLSLRILVKMSDSDIRSEITRFQKEADKQLKIPKEKKRPKTAEEKKPDRVAERKWDRYHMELLPSLQLLAVIRDAMRVIHIRAIVQFTGNRKDLEAMGITVRSQSQDIFTITATKKQLLLLGAQAACHRLRAPRLLGHTVEQASAQDEIADVHNPRPLNPTGFRGNGIPVAVIDSCLDVTHHGFRDPSGTHGTRVLNYWVQSPYTLDANGNPIAQTPPGQTPEQFSAANPGTSPDFTGLNYGRIYTTTYIDTALGLSTSPYGTANNQICCVPSGAEHGTHCT